SRYSRSDEHWSDESGADKFRHNELRPNQFWPERDHWAADFADSSSARAAENGAGANTLTGCLGGTPASATYYLTDTSGKTYTLTGNFDALRTHVGQQVQVTGEPVSAASVSSAGSATPGASPSVQTPASSGAGMTPGTAGAAGNTA